MGVLTSMGGKDVMLSGDPDQTAPLGDDSLHREGASQKDGVRGTRDAQGRPKKAPEGLVEAWELSDSGLAFFHEFDDVVLLEQRHRLVTRRKRRYPKNRGMCSSMISLGFGRSLGPAGSNSTGRGCEALSEIHIFRNHLKCSILLARIKLQL